MPLLKRKEVQMLPPPRALEGAPDDVEVWYMHKTGEVFMDYDAYSARLGFYRRKIFACSSSGKTGLDYFAALASEHRESELVKSRFPNQLKPRVLAAVNFQMEGRLDSLIDRIYDRFVNRYFRGEKVFVDLQGDKYYAQISKIFPPKTVRDVARAKVYGTTSHGSPLKHEISASLTTPSRPSTASGPSGTFAGGSSAGPIGSPVLGINSVSPSTGAADQEQRLEEELNRLAHKAGTDLDVDPIEAQSRDDPEEYLYTVQLMDENSNFEGSYMEVKIKQISRDRLSFSKSILKRYVRESVFRNAAIGSPWEIKPAVAKLYHLSTAIPLDKAQRNAAIRDDKLSKRKKAVTVKVPLKLSTPSEDGDAAGPAKKKRRKGKGSEIGLGLPETEEASEIRRELERREKEVKKHIRYPIEDLELSPLSIIDGRMLRRASGVMPDLPKKPLPRLDLPVPTEHFDQFITLWNFLNTFGRAIQLTPFTVDDFADALRHPTHDPPCHLLGDIHGTLVGILGIHNDLRVPGSYTCTAGGTLPYFAETAAETAQLNVVHQEHWVREALVMAKKWDRGPKRKGDDIRDRWEVRVTGALCQRGGCEVMPSLGRLMRFLYAADGEEEPSEEEKVPVTTSRVKADLIKAEEMEEVPSADRSSDVGDDSAEQRSGADDDDRHGDGIKEYATADPRQRYPKLGLKDKLDILQFLCDLIRDSRLIRTHIEEAEAMLTELRKERADANKERKQVLEEIALRDGRKQAEEAEAAANASVADAATTTEPATNGDAPAAKPAAAGDDEEIDELEMSDAEEAPPSRRSAAAADRSESAEIDELESEGSDDHIRNMSEASSSPAVERMSKVSARRAALDSKMAQREAEEKQKKLQAKEEKQAQHAKRVKYDERKKLEEDLQKYVKKEDGFSREFRRWAGVTRIRPLGMDRFHCRYWWFDGVGAMNLVGSGGNPLWSTGRIYVSAPNQDEWDAISEEHGGEDVMKARRIREEGNGLQMLRPGEWGWYGDEAELDLLVPWLNQKGNRESALRQAIRDWKEYIVGGMRRRLKVQEEYEARVQEDEEGTRRSNRNQPPPAFQRKPYMSYQNKLGARQ